MSLQVLHVVESLASQAGSVGLLLGGLLDALPDDRVESHVVVCADGSAPVPGGHENVHPPADAEALIERCDVVHIHGWQESPWMPQIASLAARRGKPYVLSPLGTLCVGPGEAPTWRQRLRRRFHDRRLARGAAAVTALNDLEAAELRDDLGLASVMVLPYGLSFSAYESSATGGAALPEPSAGRCLLVLGPIDPMEGLVPILKAVAELGNDSKDWHVVLAGPERDDWRQSLEAAVSRKGGSDRVLFAPAPDLAAQRAWLARACVLASCPLRVHAPVSVLQALASGVPVIASHPVAPPGADGTVQRCAPSRGELRESLRTLFALSDPQRRDLGARGRASARALFDWPVLAGRYQTLYEGLR